MNQTIAAEQISFYQENGFVAIHDFLSPTELEIWRDYVGEAVASREDRKMADGSMLEEDNYYARVFTQRINLWTDHAGMRKLMIDDRLGKIAAELAGGGRHPHLARSGLDKTALGKPDWLALG